MTATPPKLTYADALRGMNEAAYAALRLATNDHDRAILRKMASATDEMVDRL